MRLVLIVLSVCALGCALSSTQNESNYPGSTSPLFFREGWMEVPPSRPVTNEHLQNGELAVALHGPDGLSVNRSHHDNRPNDPWYIWSGSAKNGRWAISLRKKDALVDLSLSGKIRWRLKQSGPHVLRVMLELESGSWLVSNQGFGETPDWHVFDCDLSNLTWSSLNIETIETGERVKRPDLSRIRSVGWTDLQVGKGSPGCTRVDWIEVYGKAVLP
jgi:hypothetical protein